MLEAVQAGWNNKWTLEQIEWVEERYHSSFRTTRERKQQLAGIPNLDSPSNPEPHTANSRGLLVEPQTQFQDMRFQIAPQQPTMQLLYRALSKPSEQQYPGYSHQSTYAALTPVFNPMLRRPTQLAPTPVSNPMLRRPTQLAPTPVSNQMLYRPTQLAPTPVSNAGLYRFNSKIRDDCECIPKRLTAAASPTRVPPAQALSIQAPPAPVSPAQAPPVQAPVIEAPPVQASPAQYETSPIQAPPAQAYNENDKYLVLTQSPTIQQTYIKSISDPNRDFYTWPTSEPKSLLGASSDYTVKVTAFYHPHYKEKLGMTDFATIPVCSSAMN